MGETTIQKRIDAAVERARRGWESATKVKPTPANTFKFGPLSVSLPGWVGRLIGAAAGVLLLLGGSVYAWFHYIDPLVHPHKIKMDRAEATTMQESMQHFFEEPEDSWQIDGGKGEARHYASDHCTAILWHEPDGDVVRFVLHPSRSFESASAVEPEAEFASVVPAGGKDGCRGYCLTNHPGQFRQVVQEHDHCWLKVWRTWADACQHFQWFNRCGNYWGDIVWTCCRHRRR